MGHALQTLPVAKPGLATLFAGATLMLVEMPFGDVSDVWAEAHRKKRIPAQAVLAATLRIDGQVLGFDGLRAIPGRYFQELAELSLEAMALYGMGLEPTPIATPAAAPPEDE